MSVIKITAMALSVDSGMVMPRSINTFVSLSEKIIRRESTAEKAGQRNTNLNGCQKSGRLLGEFCQPESFFVAGGTPALRVCCRS
jgi:hypothetical protein